MGIWSLVKARTAVAEHGSARVAPGTVLELGPGQWRYGEGRLTIRVERVRDDLSQYYDDEVWVEGYRLDEAGVPVERLQALVRLSALPPESAARRTA